MITKDRGICHLQVTATMHRPQNQSLLQQHYHDVDQHDYLQQPLCFNFSQLEYYLADGQSNDRNGRLYQNRVLQLSYRERQQFCVKCHQRQHPHQLQQQNHNQQKQNQRVQKRRERHVSFAKSPPHHDNE